MLDVRVTGAQELREVVRDLRVVGDKDLKRELYRALNRAVKPLKADVKAEVPRRMPAKYAAVLGKSMKLASSIRTGRTAAVTIKASAKGKVENRDVRALDRGILRHPLFGNRRKWYTTHIKPGFFTDPLEKGAHKVRVELVQAINVVARKLQRG